MKTSLIHISVGLYNLIACDYRGTGPNEYDRPWQHYTLCTCFLTSMAYILLACLKNSVPSLIHRQPVEQTFLLAKVIVYSIYLRNSLLYVTWSYNATYVLSVKYIYYKCVEVKCTL